MLGKQSRVRILLGKKMIENVSEQSTRIWRASSHKRNYEDQKSLDGRTKRENHGTYEGVLAQRNYRHERKKL